MELTLEKINIHSDPYQVFLDYLRNPCTQKRYKNLLHTFLKLVPDQIYKEFLEKIPQLIKKFRFYDETKAPKTDNSICQAGSDGMITGMITSLLKRYLVEILWETNSKNKKQ